MRQIEDCFLGCLSVFWRRMLAHTAGHTSTTLYDIRFQKAVMSAVSTMKASDIRMNTIYFTASQKLTFPS
jgi:hypothetical protein